MIDVDEVAEHELGQLHHRHGDVALGLVLALLNDVLELATGELRVEAVGVGAEILNATGSDVYQVRSGTWPT